MSHTGGSVTFADCEVKSVNYRQGIPFIWIILEDGMQINIPMNTAEAIASRVRDPHLYEDD